MALENDEHRIKVTVTVEMYLDDDEYLADGNEDPRAPARARAFERSVTDRIRSMISDAGLSDDDYTEEFRVRAESEIPEGPVKLMSWTAIHSTPCGDWDSHLVESDTPIDSETAMALALEKLGRDVEMLGLVMGNPEEDPVELWFGRKPAGRVVVDYDTEMDGESQDIDIRDVPLAGIEPVGIERGHVATYEFPESVTVADVHRAIAQEVQFCANGVRFDLPLAAPSPATPDEDEFDHDM